MDPDETLANVRELATHLVEFADPDDRNFQDALELAQQTLELDRWMSADGFLPTEWSATRTPRQIRASDVSITVRGIPAGSREACEPTTCGESSTFVLQLTYLDSATPASTDVACCCAHIAATAFVLGDEIAERHRGNGARL